MRQLNTKTQFDFRRDIFAIIFLALGVFSLLCLISYSPTDPALNAVSNSGHVKNLGGIVGAYVADILYITFGISAFMASVVLLLMSALQFLDRPLRIRFREVFYCVGMLSFAATLIHLRFETISLAGHAIAGGGLLGGLIGEVLLTYLNRPGTYIFSSSAFLLFFILATKVSPRELFSFFTRATPFIAGVFSAIGHGISRQAAAVGRAFSSWIRAGFSSFKKLFASRRQPSPAKSAPVKSAPPQIKREESMSSMLSKLPSLRKEEAETVTLEPIRKQRDASLATSPTAQAAHEGREDTGRVAAAKTFASSSPAQGTAQPASPRILKRADTAKTRLSENQLKLHKMTAEGYEPPPISLLDSDEGKRIEVDEEMLKKNSLLLEKKLLDFGVEGKVLAIHPGPVITMYEFEPAAGTKLNKIVGLQDDLSLTLGGRSVRIIPHLPGKAALGIEIPNSEREIVYQRKIVSSSQFSKSQSKLAMAFGSSTAGHPVVTDLTKMPHLLVAGATGSGKSVAINSIILSILFKSSPEDVRFILVDPKMLELSIYDGIPHLLLPVVTKPKPAVQAMKWSIREMERRYRLMANAGTRNILGYNEKIKNGQIQLVTPEQAQEMIAADPEAAAHTGRMPYIVIIIDELADLMMTASQEMEESITRLAQMARAAGIHLILATQRPSVDVITGLIKANFPARVAFKVTSRHDSRTILDCIGAETLLGQGDMLFMNPQGGNLIRIHGSYVSDSDIARVVAHLKEQGAPVYDESILKEPEGTGLTNEFEEGDDELYDQAVRLVAETKQASISMVQRRLRIGYNRAARMIERMEAEGVVGPADGSKPRQVLVNGMEA